MCTLSWYSRDDFSPQLQLPEMRRRCANPPEGTFFLPPSQCISAPSNRGGGDIGENNWGRKEDPFSLFWSLKEEEQLRPKISAFISVVVASHVYTLFLPYQSFFSHYFRRELSVICIHLRTNCPSSSLFSSFSLFFSLSCKSRGGQFVQQHSSCQSIKKTLCETNEERSVRV